MSLSKVAAKLASEQNVIVASVSFFFAFSLLRRVNALLFGDGTSLAFASDILVSFGYSAADVAAASTANQAVVLAAAVLSIVAVISFGFLGSAIVSWAAESADIKPLLFLNQVPLVNMGCHLAEVFLVTGAIITSNSEFAALASSIASFRYLLAVSSLILVSVSFGQFVSVWTKKIGRDGRQKAPKNE
ncbi:hypothetical protein HDU83_005328 [Entophlyctis luteolus]|nr:hypothetical protein HDU82_006607 [Entophlyctis luteolus]KAJ3354403.1 hypothetical protein HDU83_005328 [Entophlyctis luteolus]KAJ3389530.1 hypothetical protein HDU84_008641 [Entophlyctis sp. JEL0112]